MPRSSLFGAVFLGIASLLALSPPAAAKDTMTVRVGVLAGLTGDAAPSGQAWNESAKLAADHVKATLAKLNITDIELVLADAQDSQGSPKSGVEGAQKLVQI